MVCSICRIYTEALYTLCPALRKCKAIYPKPGSVSYRDVKKQNQFLLKTVFDGKGNYLYHQDCSRAAYGVGTQWLARLRKAIQDQANDPVEYLLRQVVIRRKRQSDVVLPTHCMQASQKMAGDAIKQCPNSM